MKKILFAVILSLTMVSSAFAGVTKEVVDRVVAPVDAGAGFVNNVAVGTNNTLKGAVSGFNEAAFGFFGALNEFGKKSFEGVRGKKVE